METYFLILTTLCICAIIKAFLNLIHTCNKSTLTLPPGPTNVPIISSILWLRKSFSDLEPILRSYHAKFGPIITIRLATRPAIFISDRHLAYKALVQNGALFADRPRALPVDTIITTNQHNINSASYGSKWRIFRRNLTSEILHPSRVKSYSHARKWVLGMLLNRLQSEAGSGAPVPVRDHIQYAMFCLLVLMCFGDKLEEKQIKEIERVECNLLFSRFKFTFLNVFPKLSKVLFRKSWEQLFLLRKDVEDVLLPIIRARKKVMEERLLRDDNKEEEYVLCYVDTLLQLELPEEKRKLNEKEIVTLCNEFLNGGVDTTSTTLQWIMANLVKYPQIQEKLFSEIKQVVKQGDEVIGEEDVQKMPYLKAVVLEGLRRHPPGHFVLPHAVTEDTMLDKYLIPKNGAINFLVAEMGRDPKVWDDPMAFKPERFMNIEGEGFDITASREIKMMPFGAGRRICPGYTLAMLHLEFFVANLVRNFEWKAMKGDDIDLSEKQEFTVVMKNPLKAHIYKRFSE